MTLNKKYYKERCEYLEEQWREAENEVCSLEKENRKLKQKDVGCYYRPDISSALSGYSYNSPAPCEPPIDLCELYLNSPANVDSLIIEDEAKALKLVMNILRVTDCSIKKEKDQYIIYKEKSDIEQKYDIYMEEKQ